MKKHLLDQSSGWCPPSKEIFPTLLETAEEKLKTSLNGLVQTPEAHQTDFPGATAKASPDDQKDREAGPSGSAGTYENRFRVRKVARAHTGAQKLKQEMTAFDVTDTSAVEPSMLPQPEAVADESTKAELSALLAQVHAMQAARRRLATDFATNPTFWSDGVVQHVVTGREGRSSRRRPRLVIPTRPPSFIVLSWQSWTNRSPTLRGSQARRPKRSDYLKGPSAGSNLKPTLLDLVGLRAQFYDDAGGLLQRYECWPHEVPATEPCVWVDTWPAHNNMQRTLHLSTPAVSGRFCG